MDNSESTMLSSIEKLISIRIMQADAEAVYSLMKSERDSIFAMEIIPYYALFVQSCQEYMGECYIDEQSASRIKDIRNYIKVYGESFGKSKKRILSADSDQNEQFKSQLRFDFLKDWNVHLNLGTYWTADRHIVGNTQLLADFLGVDNIFNPEINKKQYDLGYQIGSFVASVRDGFSKGISIPTVNRGITLTSIDYYYDLNTNKLDNLFVDNSLKETNLLFLHLICNMNFVKYILRPLFDEPNTWLFRIDYVVTYYTFRAFQRLKNYYDNNDDIEVDKKSIEKIISNGEKLFLSKFRNCMMHYNLEGQDVLSIKNIEKVFFGIVENCFDGMDYHSYLKQLRELSDGIITFLEKKFDFESITLKQL